MFETAFCEYVASSILGEGGAGRVFAAKTTEGTEVAVKVLNVAQASTDKRKRFKNEIAFLQRASHPNLVPLLDHGVVKTSGAVGPFYVMPRYEGSLRDLLLAGIPSSDVVEFFGQLLHGVEAAHLLGAKHRDLKPEDVLFRRVNGNLVLAVADFGVAGFRREDQATVVETGRTRLANFQYAAPEQRVAGQLTDARTDIFALGLILNEMVTGHDPHGAGFKKIGDVDPGLAYLDSVVESMLQQRMDARPATIEQVKQVIRVHYEETLFKQRLGTAHESVVNDGVIDDPLVVDPVRIVGASWENGGLRLTLSQATNQARASTFQRIGDYSAVRGAGPGAYTINGALAQVQVDDRRAQEAIDHFKEWLPKATRDYEAALRRAKQKQQSQELEKLRKERGAAELSLAVNRRLKI